MSTDPSSIYVQFINEFKKFKYWVWDSFDFSGMTVDQAIEIEAPNHVIYEPQDDDFDYLPVVTFAPEEEFDNHKVYSVYIYDEIENSYFVTKFASDTGLIRISSESYGNCYRHYYQKNVFYRKVMDHSIDFFNLNENPHVCKNSFKDFHLIPVLRPWNNQGPLNLLSASIPNTDRRIDISSHLQEDKKRDIPTGEWEFYIDHEKWESWAACYRALVHYFHGFKMAVRLKDHELDRIYQGRITVKNYAPGNDYSKIILEYQLFQDQVSDPSKLGLCFQVWWLDWDRRPISYETIQWAATPSSSSTSEGTSYTPSPRNAFDNQSFTPDLPVKIEIISLPSNLSYYSGDTIDYSGITVRAYNSKGTIWSANSRYLSGLIPYSELVFSVSTATAGSATSEAFPVSQLLPVQWSRPDDHKLFSSAFSVTVMSALPYGTGADNLIMRTYSVYANNKISYIDDYVFYSCNRLDYLYLLSDKVVTINNAKDFYYNPTVIIVPESLYSAYKADSVWGNFGLLSSYSLSKENSTSGRDLEMELKLITRSPSKWLNDTVSYIAQYVFASYYSLNEVSFGKCKSIEYRAFYSCSSLTKADFPACISIWRDAFRYCSSLTEINFPVCTDVGNGAFSGCTSLTEADFPACISIWGGAFRNCSSLTEINFPVCTNVGNGAFSGCISLTEANFPACTTISSSAFEQCSSLTEANFPACISIGAWAFRGCSSLTEINFPACISIWGAAFRDCSSIVKVNFPNCTLIAAQAFLSCSSLTEISFPVCSYIDHYAFEYCSLITKANFPVCAYVGQAAFAACLSLSEISFPVCSHIEAAAFAGCTSLTEVNFPVCTTMLDQVFTQCSSLTEANIPLCTNIGFRTFASCYSLLKADFPACTSVVGYAFEHCSSLTEANFPACTSVGIYAFYSCSSLTVANFPACTSVGSSAFGGCSSLTVANFPACISIGAWAFERCSSLTEANFPVCTTMGGADPFLGCNSLRKLLIGGSVVVSFPGLPIPFSTRSIWHPETSSYTYEPANGSFWGSIYVPASLLGDYQTASRWSAYSSRFAAI